jgi:hypothetical protein
MQLFGSHGFFLDNGLINPASISMKDIHNQGYKSTHISIKRKTRNQRLKKNYDLGTSLLPDILP